MSLWWGLWIRGWFREGAGDCGGGRLFWWRVFGGAGGATLWGIGELGSGEREIDPGGIPAGWIRRESRCLFWALATRGRSRLGRRRYLEMGRLRELDREEDRKCGQLARLCDASSSGRVRFSLRVRDRPITNDPFGTNTPPPQGPAKVRKILDTTRDARIPQGFGRVRLSLRVGDCPITNDRSRYNHHPLQGPATVRKILNTTRDAMIPSGSGRVRLFSLRVGMAPYQSTNPGTPTSSRGPSHPKCKRFGTLPGGGFPGPSRCTAGRGGEGVPWRTGMPGPEEYGSAGGSGREGTGPAWDGASLVPCEPVVPGNLPQPRGPRCRSSTPQRRGCPFADFPPGPAGRDPLPGCGCPASVPSVARPGGSAAALFPAPAPAPPRERSGAGKVTARRAWRGRGRGWSGAWRGRG